MTRLFSGDFSTGDLTQWSQILTVTKTGNRVDGFDYGYPVQVISEDKDCGYIARFEVRTADIPAFGGGARSEVQGAGDSDVLDGNTAWYAFSIKFDTTFPRDHIKLHTTAHYDGWGVVFQLHDNHTPGPLYGPILTFGWGGNPEDALASSGADRYDDWALFQGPTLISGGAVVFGEFVENDLPFAARRLLTLPMDRGNWQDIKMQVKTSSSNSTDINNPAAGFVRVWRNGVAQTMFGGSTTYVGQTFTPSLPGDGITGQHVQLGYYRQNNITPTGIVYHSGVRIADSEASL